jgi:DNA repair protein RadD
MIPIPWPHQLQGEIDIRQAFAERHRAVLYVLSTGGGKTFLFAMIVYSAMRRGKRILILCHRVELVDQIVVALQAFGIEPDIIAAGYTRRAGRSIDRGDKAVTVASVQTLIRRVDQYQPPTLIICDEAHHCAAGNSWSTIIRKFPTAKILGTTATPCRLDGRGLGTHFDKLVVGPGLDALIAGGFLCRTRIFAPPTVDTSGLHIRMGDYKSDESESLMDKPHITGSALKHYQRYTPGEQALAFCTSVKHADHVAAEFREAGVQALSMNGGMDKQIRRMAFNDYRAGKIQLLSSCDMFSEGVDAPGARVGIMLRPTQSLTLYRQQKGRIMRAAAGKPYATLFDHAKNSTQPGFELLPGEIDQWLLSPDMEKKRKKPAPGIRVCAKCFAASPARATTCVECGAPFPVKPREIESRDGELIELTAEELAKKRERREQGRARTLQELEAFAKIKGYAPGWAKHIWQAREAKKQKETA